MKKKLNLTNSKVLALALLVFVFISCTKEESTQEAVDAAVNQETISALSSKQSATSSCVTPSLPTTTTDADQQTCKDSYGSKALNTGKLDVRVLDCKLYGYSEIGSSGVYKIAGSKTKYKDTKTRVERFFKFYTSSKDRHGSFEGTFRIEDLSAAHSYIAQAHGTGLIISGAKKGKFAHSAIYLVRARKKSGSTTKYLIDIEYPSSPWFSEKETGAVTSGKREFTGEFEINKSQDYRMVMKTGYNSNLLYFTNINFYSGTTLVKSISVPHSYTPSKGYVRYGCYSASDTGDTTSEIRWKAVSYCQNK